MSENKRTYVKPDFTMMYFKLSDGITACTYSSTTTYSAQEINCIINGTEYVFSANTSGCTNSVSSGYLVSYGGNTYFLWYDGQVNGQPTDDQKDLLEAIKEEAGVTTGTAGWHAGIATGTISSIWNSSY